MFKHTVHLHSCMGFSLTLGTAFLATGQTTTPTDTAARANLAAQAGYVNQFYPAPPTLDANRLLLPPDLVYRGAFRFPATSGATSTFTYLSGAMTFYPKGDATGSADGFTGSLFVAGHIKQMQVAEVDIPAPVISATKKYTDLPVAKLLKTFRPLGAPPSNGANPVMALTYLPAQAGQTTDKLYVAQGDGYLPTDDLKSYWISDIDFTNQVGPFRVGTDAVHCYSDYLFPIPQAWADRFTGGRSIMTGRHREGDLCGRGPAMFAISPWTDGNPPALDKPLTEKPVLRYKQDVGLANYSRGGDIYMDGAFLEASNKSAVVIVGQKGMGEGAYGTHCNYQGFHDLKGYRPYIIFYDTEELGRAAKGEIGVDKPQPYAAIDINEYLLIPNRDVCDNNKITAISYDPASNNLYLLERAKDTPVVHVFSVRPGSAGTGLFQAPQKGQPLMKHSRPSGNAAPLFNVQGRKVSVKLRRQGVEASSFLRQPMTLPGLPAAIE